MWRILFVRPGLTRCGRHRRRHQWMRVLYPIQSREWIPASITALFGRLRISVTNSNSGRLRSLGAQAGVLQEMRWNRRPSGTSVSPKPRSTLASGSRQPYKAQFTTFVLWRRHKVESFTAKRTGVVKRPRTAQLLQSYATACRYARSSRHSAYVDCPYQAALYPRGRMRGPWHSVAFSGIQWHSPALTAARPKLLP
ncbi:hypothetical protein BCR34DRAFT_298272 [Clohesyomyces aquaticus]|uniref:Uncharacterized protein n=1 Tax=Clohesyomyces aquaticus TaxID=1231657 RepID=A0A1Y1ZQM0_9PLEO|nr:hypothetical protein BCR34DRAFT_298272 [Clohesyomyces aquaticus]